MMESSNYRISQPISLNGVHDITICDYSINGGASPCIDLVDCYNIHITQCELLNSDLSGVSLTGCDNILIDNCYVANVLDGIHSLNGSNIQVKNNKIKKIGPQCMLVRFENTGRYTAGASSYSINNQFE